MLNSPIRTKLTIRQFLLPFVQLLSDRFLRVNDKHPFPLHRQYVYELCSWPVTGNDGVINESNKVKTFLIVSYSFNSVIVNKKFVKKKENLALARLHSVEIGTWCFKVSREKQ